MVQEAQNRCQLNWNPCPCGYYGAPKRECRCTPIQIRNYRNKISGPLLDRIDIHIEVPSVSYHELSSLGAGEPSAAIRGRIIAARDIQHNRFKGLFNFKTFELFFVISAFHSSHEFESGENIPLKMAISKLNFSARAYDRILKVSRTIADLAGSEQIESEHISDAIQPVLSLSKDTGHLIGSFGYNPVLLIERPKKVVKY